MQTVFPDTVLYANSIEQLRCRAEYIYLRKHTGCFRKCTRILSNRDGVQISKEGTLILDDNDLNVRFERAVSVQTVKSQAAKVLHKTRTGNKAELIRLAFRCAPPVI